MGVIASKNPVVEWGVFEGGIFFDAHDTDLGERRMLTETVKKLSNEELLFRLSKLAADERGVQVELLVHLVEVVGRPVHGRCFHRQRWR